MNLLCRLVDRECLETTNRWVCGARLSGLLPDLRLLITLLGILFFVLPCAFVCVVFLFSYPCAVLMILLCDFVPPVDLCPCSVSQLLPYWLPPVPGCFHSIICLSVYWSVDLYPAVSFVLCQIVLFICFAVSHASQFSIAPFFVCVFFVFWFLSACMLS